MLQVAARAPIAVAQAPQGAVDGSGTHSDPVLLHKQLAQVADAPDRHRPDLGLRLALQRLGQQGQVGSRQLGRPAVRLEARARSRPAPAPAGPGMAEAVRDTRAPVRSRAVPFEASTAATIAAASGDSCAGSFLPPRGRRLGLQHSQHCRSALPSRGRTPRGLTITPPAVGFATLDRPTNLKLSRRGEGNDRMLIETALLLVHRGCRLKCLWHRTRPWLQPAQADVRRVHRPARARPAPGFHPSETTRLAPPCSARALTSAGGSLASP